MHNKRHKLQNFTKNFIEVNTGTPGCKGEWVMIDQQLNVKVILICTAQLNINRTVHVNKHVTLRTLSTWASDVKNALTLITAFHSPHLTTLNVRCMQLLADQLRLFQLKVKSNRLKRFQGFYPGNGRNPIQK